MGVLPKLSLLKKNREPSAVDHAKSTIVALGKEEVRLAKKVNDARGEHEKLKLLLAEERMEMTEAHKAFVSSLRDEVNELENRKAKALEEIPDRTPEFDAREKELNDREMMVESMEETLVEQNTKMLGRECVVSGAEKMMEKHANNLAARGKAVEAQEADLHKRKVGIDNDRKNFEKDSLTREMKLRAREKDVVRAELTLPAREANLQKIGKELNDERRAVDSRYTALEEAQKHISKKKKKK